jgi:hypothetical protein
MWAAVTGDVSPEYVTSTVRRCAAVSSETVANPVPVELVAGFSLAPLKVVVNVMGAAKAYEPVTRAVDSINERILMASSPFNAWFDHKPDLPYPMVV